MNEIINTLEPKLSPKVYTLINYLEKCINWKYKLDRNNIFLDSKDDFYKILSEINNILEKLDFDNYKIDELNFFTNKVIIISFIYENKEEYVKIFYKSNLIKNIKYFVNKILW